MLDEAAAGFDHAATLFHRAGRRELPDDALRRLAAIAAEPDGEQAQPAGRDGPVAEPAPAGRSGEQEVLLDHDERVHLSVRPATQDADVERDPQ
jgi:hypothetical protein